MKWAMDRRGVSPVIAVLLLIAIAVAIGILTYVWSVGLVGTLTGAQPGPVTEQLTLVVYNAKGNSSYVNMTVRNDGMTTLNISNIFFAGTEITLSSYDGNFSNNAVNTAEGTKADWWLIDSEEEEVICITPTAPTAGRAYQVLFVTKAGAKFPFTVIWGRVG